MFPIRDTIHSRSFPIINWIIIGLNAVVFFLELSFSPADLERFVSTFGLVPERIQLSNPLTLIPFFTHMFMHGGWVHFLSNMWTLVIFGDNVEDRMGSSGYLLFYISGGLAAGALQVFANPGSSVPAIGASGAIAAVLGAYFLLFPRSQVITLIPVFIFPWFINIPAVLYLGFWFVSQLFSGVLSLATASGMEMGGVAWWAHIGGFLFGLLIALPIILRRKKERTYLDDYYPW